MFGELFDTCLDNISLLRCSSAQKVGELQVASLGDVIRSSSYVLFYIFRGSCQHNSSFLQALSNLLLTKNAPKKTSSPPKINRIFRLGKNRRKKESHLAKQEISLVVVDVEPVTINSSLDFAKEEFYYYPQQQQYNSKSRLLRALRFTYAPSLIVLQSNTLAVQTTYAYRMLMKDKNGVSFPWTDHKPPEIFAGRYLTNRIANGIESISQAEFSSAQFAVKGLFFGAKWCPPSRQVSMQLNPLYEKIKLKNPSFEIFFCSFDRSEESFNEFYGTMPWAAFPYGNQHLSLLAQTYNISGIPTFILLDEENRLISRYGRNILLADPTGKDFPWKRKPLYELTEHTVHRLSEFPTLILFTEGSPEDTEFSIQILKPCAELLISQLQASSSLLTPSGPSNEKIAATKDSISYSSINAEDIASINSEKSIPLAADPLQVFYTGEDPICDYILEAFGQGETDLPLLMIVDTVASHMAICDKPDVSESIVLDFVSEYRNGQSKVQEIPSQISEGNRRIGGIPVNLIEQIIGDKKEEKCMC